MIDINLRHVDIAFGNFHPDTAEHFGYYEEMKLLDLSNETQARQAIKKWVLVKPMTDWDESEKFQLKEALRYCISAGVAQGSYWRPGIDDIKNFRSAIAFLTLFDYWVWSELFSEPFVPADLSQYRQRVDSNFVQFPHKPELWGRAEYKDWDWPELKVTPKNS
jgi:hypothetical protein